MTARDYSVKLVRDLMGLWSYEIRTPDGRTLVPLHGISMTKEHIEQQALRRIELDAACETISGAELAERVHARTASRPAASS